MSGAETLRRWIDAHHVAQVEFLRAIVRVPSDTPPGDNAPPAEKAAALLTALGFTVERHPVPAEFLRAYGMKSVTNLIVALGLSRWVSYVRLVRGNVLSLREQEFVTAARAAGRAR